MHKLNICLLFTGLSLIIGANAGSLTVTNSCSTLPHVKVVTVSENIFVKGCNSRTYPSKVIKQNQSYTFTNLNDNCPQYLIGGFSQIFAVAPINSQITFTSKTFGCTCDKSNGCYRIIAIIEGEI